MQMRRKDKLMEENELEIVLKDTDYGILGTYGENDFPYAVPVNFVYKDNKIYLHGTNAKGHKNINLKKCPRVSFTVVRNSEIMPENFNTKFESVICFGNICIVEDEKEKILRLFLEKYSKNFIEKGVEYINKAIDNVCVYEIDILEKTGKIKQ